MYRDPAAVDFRPAVRLPRRPRLHDQPHTTRAAISEALDAGFRHITLGLPAQPYPAGVARWVARLSAVCGSGYRYSPPAMSIISWIRWSLVGT